MCYTYDTYTYIYMNTMVANCHLSLAPAVIYDKVISGHLLEVKLGIWRQELIPVAWLCPMNLRLEGMANGGLEHRHTSR